MTEPEQITPELVAPEVISTEDAVNQRRFNALIITGIVLPLLLYPFLCSLFLPWIDSATDRLLLSRFLIWGEVGLMYLYARKAEMQPFILWPEQKYDAGFYILSVVCLYLLVIAAGWISIIPKLLGLHENNDIMMKMATMMKKSPALLYFGAITAGFTEEFIFRGYILTRLSLFFKNDHLPVIISALLFSIVHLGYKSLHELIFVFLLGLLFGYYYQKYRSLSLLIFVHALVDVLAFTFMRVHK